MKTNIFVPTKINVGFQSRQGTYTGKLAYVVYFDEKGKLRKQTSWDNWRDKDIPNEIYDNKPTEGFVLNKKVGGVEESWGWDVRKTYTRIYDPRGFEFEITIPNLLWILENCNCIKGKGLEGQFIYGWDGADLVLVPVASPDYKEIERKNKVFHNNDFIKAKDLKIGAKYLSKNDVMYVYMGRFNKYSRGYWKNGIFFASRKKFIKYCEDNNIPKVKLSNGWYERYEYEEDKFDYGIVGKEHCFYYVYKNWNGEESSSFEWKSSISKFLIDVIDEDCHEKYSEYFELLEHQVSYSPPSNNKETYHKETFDNFYNRTHNKNSGYYYDFKFYSNINGKIKSYKACNKGSGKDSYIIYEYASDNNYKEVLDLFPTETLEESTHYLIQPCKAIHMIPVTIKAIYNTMKPIYKQTYLMNGKEHQKEYGV